MFNKASFSRDYEVVKHGVVKLLQSEGTNPKGLEQEISNIAMASMVPLKAQWLKVSPKNALTFLVKYQVEIKSTMVLLESYTFDSLVKTYRRVNLSPTTKKVLCGIDRYQDFVNQAIEGKLQLVSNKKQDQVLQSNTFTQTIGLKKETTKVVSKPKVATKVATPKNKFLDQAISSYDSSLGITRRVIETKSGNGQWTEIFKNEYLKDRALVKVLSNDKQFHGRYLYIKSTKGSKKQFFRIVTKSAKFIDVPINDSFAVFEYEPIQ